MRPENDLRRGRHCVSALHVHLVFVTKYRRSVFTAKHLTALKEIFNAVCADFQAQLKEFNGEDNHVHLLIEYPPKISISKLTNSLKGVSSRTLRRDHPELHHQFWKGHLWSPSYFAGSCGGAPINILRTYIEQQHSPT